MWKMERYGPLVPEEHISDLSANYGMINLGTASGG
jgi:hypothetical protein